MRAALGVLVFAVACGPEDEQHGNGSGTGGAGSQGGAAGCVDVAFRTSDFADAKKWLPKGDVVRGGLWATATAMSFAWIAYRFYPEGTPGQFLDDTVPWLALHTLNPENGAVVSQRVEALMPEGSLSTNSVITSFAGRKDGTFAVGFDYVEGTEHPQRVALGNIDSPGLSKYLVPSASGSVAAQTFAAWDGESFALHGYGTPPQFSLKLARVNDAGEVVLPFTQYGIASNVPPPVFSHRTSTNPESGRSYSADASGSAFLSGHLRDGTPLPKTGGGNKVVKASGQSTEVANMAVVSADSDGAWLMWQQNIDAAGTLGLVVQRVDLNGDATGDAGIIPIFPVDAEDGIWRWAILSHGASATIIAASDRSFYRFEYDGKKVSSPVLFVGPGEPYSFDPRDIEVIQAHGDLWVSYLSGFDLRLLKVKSGCHYPAKHAGPEP
ncbi:MAG: hypothetical protein HS104_16945 [Polyangiaceae bacterium]|nr:hypothetical protein [Polyangiaceae bacterium]MCL4755440.1 hypothetical protein [Myxococcales bacterium]